MPVKDYTASDGTTYSQ